MTIKENTIKEYLHWLYVTAGDELIDANSENEKPFGERNPLEVQRYHARFTAMQDAYNKLLIMLRADEVQS